MRKKFRIEYFDPETETIETVFENFEDTEDITAEQRAEDAAYSYADKHWHCITEIK